jgi:hypothetical protein
MNKPDDIFGRAADELQHLDTFVQLAEAALRIAAQSTRTLELLERHNRVVHHSPEQRDAALREAKAREEFAAIQLATGSPYLYGLAAIRLWTIIESFVDGLLHRLVSRADVRQSSSPIANLKGPVVEFAGLAPTEQTACLVSALRDNVRASQKLGVGQFECMLEIVGCTGGVPDEVRRCLLELQQVRHVLVHRSGRVDQKLLSTCPWITRSIGEDVRLTARHLHQYHRAASWYFLDLSNRSLSVEVELKSPAADEVVREAASTLATLLEDIRRNASHWTADDNQGVPSQE